MLRCLGERALVIENRVKLTMYSSRPTQPYHTVKKVCDIAVSSRDVTNQTLPGREWPGRVWLVTPGWGQEYR
jgi:hypothetical protein